MTWTQREKSVLIRPNWSGCTDRLTYRKPTGQVKESNSNPSETGHDRAEILALKDNQIADLQKQLEKAEMRETALIDEKSKLLDLLSAEKDEKRALMPPVDEKPKTRNWLLWLVGAR